jgi:glucose 1-dehydrogenase
MIFSKKAISINQGAFMRVLITGASRGIGRAVALKLAAAGAKIAVCGSSHAHELDSLVQEVSQLGGQAIPLVGNLQLENTPADLVTQAVSHWGGLDAVIGNAGITAPGLLATLSPAQWDQIFTVNVRAQWLLARAAYPHLQTSQGSLVYVASMCGVQPYPGGGAYSSGKAALIMLARQLAQEWATDRIRVNCVSPGFVRTPLTQAMFDQPEVRAAREALVPLGRIAESDQDIAGIVQFLINPESGYITGQNILADGGLIYSVQAHIKGRPVSQS